MSQLKKIKLEQIKANPNQPRKHFDEESLKELSASIQADGLRSPILVRPVGEGYEIVQGERRYRAAEIAGMKEIDAFVDELDEEDAFHLAVIENIQREQLTPIEEAQAFQRYVEMGYTHEQIAQKVNKSRTYVTTKLRMLNLIPEIQDWIAEGRISEGHAKKLLSAKSNICNLMEVSQFIHKTEDPFEIIQSWFLFEFKDKEKISVSDVSEWLDGFKHLLIGSELGIMKFLAKEDKERERKETKKLGLLYFELSLLLGGDYTKINEKDIDFYFNFEMENREEGIKGWEIYKAHEEWKEFITEHPFTNYSLEELVDKIKEKPKGQLKTVFVREPTFEELKPYLDKEFERLKEETYQKYEGELSPESIEEMIKRMEKVMYRK